MKRILIIFILCFFALPAIAGNPYKIQTDNAEESFRKGDYTKAIEIYETLISVEKVNNPSIFYNLANAYYRTGSIGKAVLNIEKAARLAPRDKDIRNNRTHINSVAEGNNSFSTSEYMTAFYTLNEISVLVFAAAALFLIFLSLLIIKYNKYFKRAALFFFFLLIVLLPGLFLKAYNDIYIKKAVIVEQTQTRSGPGENNPEVSTISSGKIVEIISENAGWYRIRMQIGQNEIEGWIEINKAGII